MKSRPFLFLFSILWITASCQKGDSDSPDSNSWKKIGDFEGTAVRGAASFTIGTNAYIVSGTTGNQQLSQVYQYNSETNSWSSKSNFPGTARLHATGFSIDSKGYVGLGMDASNLLKDFWEYNSETDSWTQLADFPGGIRAMVVSLVINGKAYVISGFSSLLTISDQKDVWEFNPEGNTWTQKSDFPGNDRSSASGFVIGSKGYFGTGTSENDFWEYDPSSDHWTQIADFPGSSRGEALGFSIGSKGYLGCGSSFANGTFTLYKDFYEYDPTNNSWTKVTDFSGQARTMASGFAIGNSGYFGIGASTSGQNYSDFWKFTPDN